ncbi:SDR family oxidoreductase [Rhizobium cauense]|uniref:SDR family oxidoreductase n=1 Tax=Rhizobium cauense TaxID=1166683 RepID=UPI001C6EBC6F|nr:SDR family oxidoreductase [Rhizobium cauense]MBW9117998.1 SDR family oxidoreductase [Rhizobium cauense]
MSSEATSAKQREIQEQVAKADNKKRPKDSGAMQAGARRYPEPPFPKVHQSKPGFEADLPLAPMYDAPFYKGSDKLNGKVALITGGDSGIGRSIAILFAREGADVAIVHLDEAKDAADTKAAVEKEGRRCLVMRGDVKDPDFCRKAVEKTVMQFSRLDILVNNAAFQVHTADIEDLTDDHFDETLKTNLYGYFFMARAAIPHLGIGSAIINTGSVTGIDGSKELLDYSMSKGGIHAFTKALSSQLVPKGIRVNAVAPGPVWTPLNPSDKQADDVAEFGSKTAMKRAAQPEEIAPAYVFLASAQMSSYITGEILPIVGGY